MKTRDNLGWVSFFKKVSFQLFFLNEERDLAERTSSRRSFQILVASYAKLRPKCFLDLYIEAQYIEAHHQIDFYVFCRHYICLGLRKGSKYFGWPLCRNLYTNRAVVKTD